MPLNANTVQKKSGINATTQEHLKVAEIRDGVTVLRDGSLRAVIKVQSVNFDLKSEEEQNSLIYAYQSFLNTLECPIQILIRSTQLDVDMYLEKMSARAVVQNNPLLKDQMYDYIDFIKKLVDLADIMKKDFYVIVPNDAFIATKALSPLKKIMEAFRAKESKSDFERRQKDFESLKKGLDHRTQVVKNGLENMGLKVDILGTEELIELFYESYNPEIAKVQKVDRLKDLDLDYPEEVKVE